MPADAQSISALGFISLGMLAMALYTAYLAWFASASRRWPTATGRMLYSAIPGQGRFPTATYVHYSYIVDGVTYESKRLRFGLFPPRDQTAASAELRRLQGTGRLRVYYDPKKPSRSCLLTGANDLTMAMPILLLVVAVVFMAADILVSSSL
jgi:hypothetical protein